MASIALIDGHEESAHTNYVSEAHEEQPVRVPHAEYATQLRFTPDDMLEQELRRFLRTDDTVHSLGRYGLFLYSDGSIRSQGLMPSRAAQRAGAVSPKVSDLGRTIRERGGLHRPLAPRLQMSKLPDKGGVSIRTDVVLDELTAGAVMNLMKVNYDRSIAVHIDLRRRQLVSRDEYIAACRSLYEKILEGESRIGIDMIELVQSAQKQ